MPLFGIESVEFRNGLLHTEEPDIRIRIAVVLVNVLITPAVLVVHSVRAYLLPCVQALVTTVLWRLMFSEDGCIDFFRSWLFEDREFRPVDESIGDPKLRGKVRWVRAREIVTKSEGTKAENEKISRSQAKLFEDGITASDICQGALGDCWLLSALAALSERPHVIQRAFLTDTWNMRGKYRIRLWSEWEKQFVVVSVDDFLPVDASSGKPLFTQPNGNEIWVMIMEKAFAKLFGSYANISGGYPLFALRTITGDESFKFSRSAEAGGRWRKLSMRIEIPQKKAESKKSKAGFLTDRRAIFPSSTSNAGSKPDIGFYYSTKDSDIDGDHMYEQLDRLSRYFLPSIIPYII
jgi:calpain-15